LTVIFFSSLFLSPFRETFPEMQVSPHSQLVAFLGIHQVLFPGLILGDPIRSSLFQNYASTSGGTDDFFPVFFPLFSVLAFSPTDDFVHFVLSLRVFSFPLFSISDLYFFLSHISRVPLNQGDHSFFISVPFPFYPTDSWRRPFCFFRIVAIIFSRIVEFPPEKHIVLIFSDACPPLVLPSMAFFSLCPIRWPPPKINPPNSSLVATCLSGTAEAFLAATFLVWSPPGTTLLFECCGSPSSLRFRAFVSLLPFLFFSFGCAPFLEPPPHLFFQGIWIFLLFF